MEKIIEKYFGDDKTIYFHPADIIGANQYLAYRRRREAVILAVGSDNGEVDIGIFWVGQELEHCIKHIIYSVWRT